MKMHSREVSLTGTQHEFHLTAHDNSVEFNLRAVKHRSESGFHYMLPHNETDATIIRLIAIRNANRLGHVMSPDRMFYIFENRYVGLRLSESDDGRYTLLIVADMNMLDLVKRPTEVYGRKYYVGYTAVEHKQLLKTFDATHVGQYTRKPISISDLEIGVTYDSPIANLKWRLIRFENGGKKAIMREVYGNGEMADRDLETRTAALVRWINGDPHHASVGD